MADISTNALSPLLFPATSTLTQIVLVLDKSSDNSFNVLKKLSLEDKKIKVLHLSRRYGHQESIIAGIEHSLKADMIITMDMDLQHPPSLIPKLIEKINCSYCHS
jgi:dolichol-phosphate mannosyltransferase